MKRFFPYTTYKINGELRYTSIAPDGTKKDSASWIADRINEIRSIFLQKNKNNQFQLKKYQKRIMISILSGNDTFVILPTGSGKSLCFQAPSIFFPGITLVITPLVALIENQVENFNGNSYPLYHPFAANYYEGIHFKAIYPGMDGLSTQAMFSEIRHPHRPAGSRREIQYKFLYVSPERLCNPKFLRALKDAEQDGLRIDHVVIDEVHCMSHWGFEFRESYLHIADFIDKRPVRPIISAFTATATPKDIAEIKNILNFPVNPERYAEKKYHEEFHVEKRENLSLRVIPCLSDTKTAPAETASDGKKTRFETLLGLLNENMGKVCIIYRTTAAGVDELYRLLKSSEMLKDRLGKYHAQMPERTKSRNKNCFLNSREENAAESAKAGSASKPCRNIMIATKAFGMGIDKNDISLVIHYDVPRSLEDYYQEVGRAGRDTEKVPTAQCFLLYSIGPKNEKGTLHYTINWVTSGKDSSGLSCMPVASQFSDEIKENIYFWSYYRLCYMMKYCNIVSKNPGAAHNFIIRYLENRFSASQIADDFNSFYSYIISYYPIPAAAEERFVKKYLFQGADIDRFPVLCSGQEKQNPGGLPTLRPDREKQCADKYHAEIRRLVGEVNELHINNTYLANLLRHHPEEYQLNRPYILSEENPDAGQEWKSQKNKKVKGETSSSLRLSDIRENAAFIFVSDRDSCEAYVNAAWNMRQNKEHEVSAIFTVNYHHVINGVLNMREGSFRLLRSKEELSPYARYLGCDVKGLFPQESCSLWRKTKKSSKNPSVPEAVSETNADSLFAFVSGAGKHELTFTVHGDEKLSYFDLCVLDAIYSIEATQRETIYVQTVWEILTGRNPEYSTRQKLDFRAAVQNSIDKMRAMSISISDNQCAGEITEQVFLPLTDKPRGQKGYSYFAIPPLFLYAEEMNGQIIKVPVSLLNVSKIKKSTLWKKDFRAEFPLCASDARALEQLQKHPYSFTPSVDNALLCHYLIHRIAISKNKKRGNFILFSTVRRVIGTREDSCLLHKKAAVIMDWYQSIGFLHRYYFYITDYNYQLTEGSVAVDTAYFRVKTVPTKKHRNLRGTDYLLLSDLTLVWSPRYNKYLIDDNSNFEIKTVLSKALSDEGRVLSADARATLDVISFGRMDGIILQHG